MLYLSKVATQLVYPLDLAMLAAGVGAVLVWRGRARAGASLVAIAMLGLWVTSMPVVAFSLLRSLEVRYAEVPAEQAPAAGAIVVLGGGLHPFDPREGRRRWPDLNAAGDRLLHAARLYRAGKAPLVIATGGTVPWEPASVSEAEAAAELLVELGVPRTAIVLEPRSRSTWDDARYTRELLDERGIHDVLLVTSALHMERSLAVFEAFGVYAIPAPTDYEADDAPGGVLGWLPDSQSLNTTSRAFKEYLGLLVYSLRVQIETGPPH